MITISVGIICAGIGFLIGFTFGFGRGWNDHIEKIYKDTK